MSSVDVVRKIRNARYTMAPNSTHDSAGKPQLVGMQIGLEHVVSAYGTTNNNIQTARVSGFCRCGYAPKLSRTYVGKAPTRRRLVHSSAGAVRSCDSRRRSLELVICTLVRPSPAARRRRKK
jgi:hypothetical protein